MLAGTLVFPGILAWYGDPDWGIVATSYLGMFLCCCAFVSAGLFSSSLTREPVAAGLGGVLLLLPFWLAGTSADLVSADWLKAVLAETKILLGQGDMERWLRL